VIPEQLAEAQRITDIACVQNFYNVANRNDDAFIGGLAKKGIAYVPFFPLGGFTPLQSSVLDRVAMRLRATPMQVVLAWLLQRSPNILLIPGTSSIDHLRQNLDVQDWSFLRTLSPNSTQSLKIRRLQHEETKPYVRHVLGFVDLTDVAFLI
jgi:aryl-alcohol dehydrogenase-like predicted oxidoreductase